jgi:thiamine pyrophosphokinase
MVGKPFMAGILSVVWLIVSFLVGKEMVLETQYSLNIPFFLCSWAGYLGISLGTLWLIVRNLVAKPLLEVRNLKWDLTNATANRRGL